MLLSAISCACAYILHAHLHMQDVVRSQYLLCSS